MKCAIVIASDVKQIMFTPETHSEKDALKLITSEDDITVDKVLSASGYPVIEGENIYLSVYECIDSVMLILRPKFYGYYKKI